MRRPDGSEVDRAMPGDFGLLAPMPRLPRHPEVLGVPPRSWAGIAEGTAGRNVTTLAEHQARLRRLGQRPLDADEIARIYPDEAGAS